MNTPRTLAAVVLTVWVCLSNGACDPESPDRCQPGARQACACTTGHTGQQACLADGTWGACSCVGDGGFSPYQPTDASRTDARRSLADAGSSD